MAKFLDDAGVQHLVSKLDERYMTKAAADETYVDKTIGDRLFMYNRITALAGDNEDLGGATAYLNPAFTTQLIDIYNPSDAATSYKYAYVGVNLDTLQGTILADMTPGSDAMQDGNFIYAQYFGPRRAILRLIGSGWVSSSVGGLVLKLSNQNIGNLVYKEPPVITFEDPIMFLGTAIENAAMEVPGMAYNDGSIGYTPANRSYTLQYVSPWATGTPANYAKDINSPTLILIDYIVMPSENNYNARVLIMPQFINTVVKTGLPD